MTVDCADCTLLDVMLWATIVFRPGCNTTSDCQLVVPLTVCGLPLTVRLTDVIGSFVFRDAAVPVTLRLALVVFRPVRGDVIRAVTWPCATAEMKNKPITQATI